VIDIFLHLNIAITIIGITVLVVEFVVKRKKKKNNEYIKSKLEEM
jgi:heme exporter protein D